MKQLFAILVIFSVSLNLYAQPNYPTDPEEAQLVYTDMVNFLEAYRQLVPECDTIELLEEHYFAKASAGMEEYINRHGLTSELLKKALEEDPEGYGSIAGFLKEIDTFKVEYQQVMEAYKAAVPSAMLPPTYLIVGANRGIAQASPKGQLVTIVRNITKPTHSDQLLTLITHELTHFHQARTMGFQKYIGIYQKENNMLDLILREGGADFVAYSLVRKNTDTYKRLDYVNERLEALKKRFQLDLANQDPSYWLWDSIDQEEIPILLGYTIGYKICEAYYQKMEDKVQALEDILGMPDPEMFLKASGFLEE